MFQTIVIHLFGNIEVACQVVITGTILVLVGYLERRDVVKVHIIIQVALHKGVAFHLVLHIFPLVGSVIGTERAGGYMKHGGSGGQVSEYLGSECGSSGVGNLAVDGSQGGAVGKAISSHVSDIGRNVYGLQCLTFIERIGADACERCGQCDRGDIGASVECSGTDAVHCQLTIVDAHHLGHDNVSADRGVAIA